MSWVSKDAVGNDLCFLLNEDLQEITDENDNPLLIHSGIFQEISSTWTQKF